MQLLRSSLSMILGVDRLDVHILHLALHKYKNQLKRAPAICRQKP